MKVKVRKDAKSAYIAYQVHTSKHPVNWEWAETLEKIQGLTIDVETDNLFIDQFNTVPILDIAVWGLRLMNRDVAEVIDDIRPLKMRCNNCGKTIDLGDNCPVCGESEYLTKFKNFKLWTGKTATQNGE